MRLAKNCVLLAMCFSIVSAPVHADGILDSLKNYAGVTVTGWGDLEAKRTALETQVAESLKAGKLSAAQAADFRSQLKMIADAEAQAKAANRRMSFRENVQFTRDIYGISSQIDQAINNQVTSTPDIDTLQTQLQSKVAKALASGHLTTPDATTLKAELQHVADMEAAYKDETGGTLTPRQIEVLAAELNSAQSQIDQQVKLGESAIPQLNNRRADHKVGVL